MAAQPITVPFVSFRPMERELDADLRAAFARVLDNSWYIEGKEDAAFEAAFADYCGAKYCVGCGNGLDALVLILKALGIGPGDEVIVPSNTFIATVLAVSYAGATPVFVEPVLASYNIDPACIEAAITEKTKAIMAVHLYGQCAPMDEINAIAHAHGAWFHTDAVQAVGHIPVDVKALGVDMLSLSGHKFHAPKGIGALYVKKGILPNIFMDGGAQEKGRRAGTENLASIVGLGEAITVATASLEENMARITAMRDRLIDSLLQLPRTRLNGSREHRLPGNLNISFEGIEGESLLLRLDMAGICASSGSACTSGSLDPSHVLMAIGLKHEVAHGSLRLSLSELTTEEDIDYIIAQVPPIVEGLRAMSPVWEKIKDL